MKGKVKFMSEIKQMTSIRSDCEIDTEDENLEVLTEEQIAEFNKIAGDDDCNPFKTFATYEEFEADLIRHIEIGLKEKELGLCRPIEELFEEMERWVQS